MKTSRLLFIGLFGAIAGLFVLALASYVSGVATWDARDFMGGYRDWDGMFPFLFVPVVSVLFGMFVAISWAQLDQGSFRVPYVLIMTFFSGLSAGELGMDITNIQPSPISLVIFYTVYLSFAVITLLAVNYHQRIKSWITTIMSLQSLQPHRQGS